MVQYVCFKEHLHKIVSFGNFRENVKKIRQSPMFSHFEV